MMKYIKPKDSVKILKTEINEIRNTDEAIKIFFKFFKEYKIKEELEHEEEDMMLFQYGNNDWHDGNGKEFNFNLTRQFEIPNEDEFLQLRLTLFFDSVRIGELKSYNSWSTQSSNIIDWERLIKNSKGYQISKNLKPKRFEIELRET